MANKFEQKPRTLLGKVGCWFPLVFLFILALLFYYMPGMPPRNGEWYGNIQVDLDSGQTLNSVPLGKARKGHYKYKWHLAELGDVDIEHPMKWFTSTAQIGDKISGYIIISGEDDFEYWREPFDVQIKEFKKQNGEFFKSYTGTGYFGNDIKLDPKVVRTKNLNARVIIDHIDNDSFTDGLGFKVSFFNTVACRHIECLLD